MTAKICGDLRQPPLTEHFSISNCVETESDVRVQHFGSIDEVMAFLKSEVPGNPFLGMKNARAYNWIRDGDEMRLLPSPSTSFSSPFLYRGQTTRYSPCLPGVFRGMPMVHQLHELSNLDEANLFLARIRMEEFVAVLPQHPSHAYSRQLKLMIFAEALAQHYEINTDRIDLTQDADVAAFFATNWRDENGSWHPAREGQGVIYRTVISDLKQVLGKEREHNLEWIGKQAWPRPGEQKAWTLRLPLGADFEKFPVDILTFDHQEKCSTRFHDLFVQGTRLFPPDVLSELADQIKSSPTVDWKALSDMVKGWYGWIPEDQHKHALDACAAFLWDHFGIGVEDRGVIQLSPEQMVQAQAQTEQMKKTFLDDVGLLMVRQGKHVQ